MDFQNFVSVDISTLRGGTLVSVPKVASLLNASQNNIIKKIDLYVKDGTVVTLNTNPAPTKRGACFNLTGDGIILTNVSGYTQNYSFTAQDTDSGKPSIDFRTDMNFDVSVGGNAWVMMWF